MIIWISSSCVLVNFHYLSTYNIPIFSYRLSTILSPREWMRTFVSVEKCESQVNILFIALPLCRSLLLLRSRRRRITDHISGRNFICPFKLIEKMYSFFLFYDFNFFLFLWDVCLIVFLFAMCSILENENKMV